MDKLKAINNALRERESKGDVVRVGAFFYDKSLNMLDYPKFEGNNANIHFGVAPKEGTIDIEKLNEFMLGLIPNLNPSGIQPFVYDTGPMSKDGLWMGRMYFEENVGRRVPEFTEDFLKYISQFPENKKITEPEDYSILIRVVLYPDEKIGRDNYGGLLIDKEELRKYKSDIKKPGFLRRIFV